ncbi:MAG: SWIM zinc finger family protein [Bacteroidetes bacterium]|nr:MAG: SWIM zinc finger family protein [Bacteroidota bacterium]TAG87510.1 MAG: SWIM zinc finger family protein [Bacteroidota bacterium]
MEYIKIIFIDDVKKITLQTFLKDFKKEKLKEIVGETIYNRGISYIDFITQTEAKSINHIKAYVDGNYDEYKVNIRIENSRLEGYCSCKYFETEALCKHIVGLILYIKENEEEVFFEINAEQKIINMENKKLIALEKIGQLLDSITINFIDTCTESQAKHLLHELKVLSQQEDIIISNAQTININQNTDKETSISDEERIEAAIIFDNCVKDVTYFLNSDNINATNIEVKLLKKMNSFKKIVKKGFLVQICDFYLELLDIVGKLEYEGELFVDNYYDYDDDDEYQFEGSDFCDFILEHINLLDDEAKLYWYFKYIKLEYIFEGYSYIDDELKDFFDIDKNYEKLKKYSFQLLEENDKKLSNYYRLVENKLNNQEKEKFLGNLFITNESYLEQYISIFDINKDKNKIKNIYETYFNHVVVSNIQQDILYKYTSLFSSNEELMALLSFLEKYNTEDVILEAKRFYNIKAVYVAYINTLKKLQYYDKIESFYNTIFLHFKLSDIDFNFLQEYIAVLVVKNKNKEVEKFIYQITDKDVYRLTYENFAHLKLKLPDDYFIQIDEAAKRNLIMNQYVQYLKKSNQQDSYYKNFLDNTLAIYKQERDLTNAFFKEPFVRANYREQTIKYYEMVIEDKTQSADSYSYMVTTETLLLLKQIDPELAMFHAKRLKLLYKRRGNFVAELNKAGF